MACPGGKVVCTVTGNWSGEPLPAVGGGLQGGSPFVLFDEDVSNTLVVSPYSNFMAGSQVVSAAGGDLQCGVMGGVASIPAGFDYETVVYYGAGVNAAMRGWGAALQRRSGKSRAARDADHSINYLGYWTDNGARATVRSIVAGHVWFTGCLNGRISGAYYYYITEPGLSYEQTLIDVNAYAAANAIPYSYFQLDSWW